MIYPLQFYSTSLNPGKSIQKICNGNFNTFEKYVLLYLLLCYSQYLRHGQNLTAHDNDSINKVWYLFN